MKEYRYDTFKKLFVAICDAIRKKESSTEPIAHQDIPDRIDALNVGSGEGVEIITEREIMVIKTEYIDESDISIEKLEEIYE